MSHFKWTWSLSAVVFVLNLGLFSSVSVPFQTLLTSLQFDGLAIRYGEWWRLLTANLVHFNPNHFFLDVGVFVVLGFLYERSFRGFYPWLLLTMALAGSIAGLVFWPERTICRGLSAVDSGLFAAALCVEFRLAWRDRTRWLWVGPATAIFVAKNIYECATGQSFFSTQALLGPTQLAVAAHTSAILAALVFLTVARTIGCGARGSRVL